MSIIETVDVNTSSFVICTKPSSVIWTPKLTPIVESTSLANSKPEPEFKFAKKIPVSTIPNTKKKSFWGKMFAVNIKHSWVREGLVYSAEEDSEEFEMLVKLREAVESTDLPSSVRRAFNTWTHKDTKKTHIDFTIGVPEDDQSVLVDAVQRAFLGDVTFTMDEDGVILSDVKLKPVPTTAGEEPKKKKRRVNIIQQDIEIVD